MELVVAHYEYEGDTNGGYVPNTAPLTEPETKGNPNLKPAELTLITGFALYFVDSQGNRTPTGSWQSISGGEECVEVVETTTGENQHEQKRPGQAYFTDITLKGPLSKDRKAVMDWINDTAKGKAQARNLVLVFLNDKGEGQRTWNLLDTYPVSYTPGDYSPSSKENVETIKAKPGMIEMAD